MTVTSEQIRNFWEKRAKKFGSSWQATLNEEYLRRLEIKTMLSVMARYRPLTVMDIGCGNGYSTKRYANSFPNTQFIGIDFSQSMIAWAKTDSPPNCVFLIGNVTRNKDLPQGPFDLIISQRCLQNLPEYQDQKQAIDNLLSRKAPGGRLALMECSRDGVQKLNHTRSIIRKKPLDNLEPWHNNFFVDERLLNDFEAEIVHFSSTYTFLNRVIHPRLARVGYHIPPIGTFGYDKLYLIK